jgi:hypothetical protein
MTLDKTGWLSILTGGAVAAAGAGLAYLAELSTGGTFGKLGPLAAAVLAVLANTLRKALLSNTVAPAAPPAAAPAIELTNQPTAAAPDPPSPKSPF